MNHFWIHFGAKIVAEIIKWHESRQREKERIKEYRQEETYKNVQPTSISRIEVKDTKASKIYNKIHVEESLSSNIGNQYATKDNFFTLINQIIFNFFVIISAIFLTSLHWLVYWILYKPVVQQGNLFELFLSIGPLWIYIIALLLFLLVLIFDVILDSKNKKKFASVIFIILSIMLFHTASVMSNYIATGIIDNYIHTVPEDEGNENTNNSANLYSDAYEFGMDIYSELISEKTATENISKKNSDALDIGLFKDISSYNSKTGMNLKNISMSREVFEKKEGDIDTGKYINQLLKRLSERDKNGINYTKDELLFLLDDDRAKEIYYNELKNIVDNFQKKKDLLRKKTSLVEICLRPEKIEKGLEFVRDKGEILKRVQEEYNVEPLHIVSILMIESDFCYITGEYRVFNVFLSQVLFLFDVTYEVYGNDVDENIKRKVSRKVEQAIRNFTAFLKSCKIKKIDPLSVRGSYAGAIGCPQFMPSSFVFAVDGNDDGKIDLYNVEDSIFSIANYLNKHGYDNDVQKSILKYNPDNEFLECILRYSNIILEKERSRSNSEE